MRKDYKGVPWRLDNLQHYCLENTVDILADYDIFYALHEEDDSTNVIVRYVIDEGKFGYAYMGNFFFIYDCMYVMSDDDSFKESHNDKIKSIAADYYNTDYFRTEKYVTRVIFAGVRTPFKDERGDWIYTGDMVLGNEDILSGVCAFHPYDELAPIEIPNRYGLMLDNCMYPLDECRTLKRVGTIFFKLDRNEPEVNMEQIIGGTVQHRTFDKEFLECARYTPSFYKEQWKFSANGIIGVEYNWRR